MRTWLVLFAAWSSLCFGDASGRVERSWDEVERLNVTLSIHDGSAGKLGGMYVALVKDDYVVAFLQQDNRDPTGYSWVEWQGGLGLELMPIGPLPFRVDLVAAEGHPSICARYKQWGRLEIWAGWGIFDERGQQLLDLTQRARSKLPEEHIIRTSIQQNLSTHNRKWSVWDQRCVQDIGGG